MTIALELPPEVEARYLAEAQRKGVPVGEVVKAYLVQSAPAAVESVRMSPEEWGKELDEVFDSLGNVPTLLDEAITRESIYTRED